MPVQPMTFADYGRDLCDLLEGCGVSQCVFVGLSMGTPTGLHALAALPEAFAGFVAVDGVARSAVGREAFWRERRDTARSQGMEVIAGQTAARWLPGADRGDSIVARLRTMIAGTPVEGFAAATAALASYDLSAGLDHIACPFLGVYGEADGTMPDAMQAQFGVVPGGRFAGISGAGHVPPLQCPTAFNQVLGRFLDHVFSPSGKENRS